MLAPANRVCTRGVQEVMTAVNQSKTRRVTFAVALLPVALAACGDDDDADADANAESPSSEAGGAVGTATTDFGEALVDAGGMSLYGFLNDTGGISACYDACAETWPPVLVDGSDLPAGLDAAVFSVSERTDGTHQLVAGDWPLYLYAPDTAPGDTQGQGVGEVWFLVDPSGELISGTASGLTYDY